MSEKLGPVTFGKSEEMIFLGREIATEKNYSEETAAQIDKEVNRFITNAYQTAHDVIMKHFKVLEGIARALIERETLEQEEFVDLVKKFKLKLVGA